MIILLFQYTCILVYNDSLISFSFFFLILILVLIKVRLLERVWYFDNSCFSRYFLFENTSK
jgi:hypothetical protein